MKNPVLQTLLALATALPCAALTVNADFSRDIVGGTNPGGNPAPVLYSGTGPSADTGTLWNNLMIPLSSTGDLGTDTITHPIQFNDLTASDGSATTIDIQLTNGFQRAFNGTATSATAVTALQNDRVFSSGGAIATLKVQGLDPAKRYDLFLIGTATFSTTFTINSVSKFVASPTYDGSWTEGGEYASFTDIAPSAGGEITISVQDTAATGFGAISGMQIATTRTNFLYADSVSSTGGQFNNLATYSPANLLNGNGTNDSNGPFTSPSNLINTTVNYIAASTNYASSTTSPTPNFDITFDFNSATDLNGMHVWNYIFRNGAANTSYNNGVNAYNLTFYDGPAATGSTIGPVFSGNLLKAQAAALNSAQTVYFPSTYAAVRSVKMRVVSNFGVNNFTGMCELAFNSATATPIAAIQSFTTSAALVQKPATATVSWSVSGPVTSLEITPDIGDVLPLTTAGSGSIPVFPIGDQTYTLTLNGSIQQTLQVIGLPTREKLHIYLLIGQSNMQGEGSDGKNAVLDAPDPRVIKFGSRDGMENTFATGGHRLTSLTWVSGSNIGMGVEFGKTLIAAETDPEVVICLINHALGATAIQWWAPGVPHSKVNRPGTSNPYYLYDEAIQRVQAASTYGVVKGVLWHQGEYNANNNTNPSPEPELYATRLQALVDNLRNDLNNPSLPFVCGKLVPGYSFAGDRITIEAALADLPNQRGNTFCVDNNLLGGNASDAIHFDAPSQRLLGQRYANAMLGFYSDPFLLYLGGFLTPVELANPLLIDPAGDNDHDGYSNFLEYAFRMDPTKHQDIQPVNHVMVSVPGVGDFPAISFRQRLDSEAPQYVVQVSGDLENWASNLDGPTAVTEAVGSPVSNGDGTFTATVRALAPPTPCFLRVRVSLP